MKMKRKAKSKTLASLYETAQDLHELGVIDKKKMLQLESMCLQEIDPYDSGRIKALRQRLQLSQTVMAYVMNISASTIRKWEIGEKRPSGPSLKLLDLLDRKGLDAVL